MLTGGPISWMSKKQKSVATSTTEAEYMAMSTCSKEGVWLTQMLRDMDRIAYLKDDLNRISIKEEGKYQSSSPTQLPILSLPALSLNGDNQATLNLVQDAHIHDRSKHIDVAYHNVRDLYKKKRVQVDFIPSHEMIADGFTKPLTRDAFKSFVSQLGLTQ